MPFPFCDLFLSHRITTNSEGINLQVLDFHDDSAKLEAFPRVLVSKLRWISQRLRFCYLDGAPLGLEPLPLQVCVARPDID